MVDFANKKSNCLISFKQARPSHGRGPRFDPLCAHQKSPCLLGFCTPPKNPIRQLKTERSAKRAHRPVDYPWTLFSIRSWWMMGSEKIAEGNHHPSWRGPKLSGALG